MDERQQVNAGKSTRFSMIKNQKDRAFDDSDIQDLKEDELCQKMLFFLLGLLSF